MNIDETKIEDAITEKTKAIVPVHYAGVACEMDTIMDIAKRHAWVQDVVSIACFTLKLSCIQAEHFFVKGPSPHSLLFSSAAWRMYSSSVPIKGGLLNSIIVFPYLSSIHYCFIYFQSPKQALR